MAASRVLIASILLAHAVLIDRAVAQCENGMFILISSKNVFLYHADRLVSVYQAKKDVTIAQGVVHKRTNTVLLLLNEFNVGYTIASLTATDNPNGEWKENPIAMVYPSRVSLAAGQRYAYVLEPRNLTLQTFAVPLTSTPTQQIQLLNLPRSSQLLSYLAFENFQRLWVLLETNQRHELHICPLKSASCQLYMNIYDLLPPIQLVTNERTARIYLQARNYLIIFEYPSDQTNYTIHAMNSTQDTQFLTLCESADRVEYVSIDRNARRQVCYQTCQALPLRTDGSDDVHTIHRLSPATDALYCSKKRQISKVVLLILILADLAVVLGYILWLAYGYFSQPALSKQLSCTTVSASEKDSVTHF